MRAQKHAPKLRYAILCHVVALLPYGQKGKPLCYGMRAPPLYPYAPPEMFRTPSPHFRKNHKTKNTVHWP